MRHKKQYRYCYMTHPHLASGLLIYSDFYKTKRECDAALKRYKKQTGNMCAWVSEDDS